MPSRALLALGTLVCLAPRAPAQQTLVLANGDRLTGTLKRIDGHAWVFGYDGGDVKIPVEQIAGYASNGPVGLRLADGSVVAAVVSAAGDSLTLTLPDSAVRRVAPAALEAVGPATNLKALQRIAIGWFSPLDRFWTTTGSLGFSDKRGNSRAWGVSAGLEIARRTTHDRLDFAAGVAHEEAQPAGGAFQTTVARSFLFFEADVYFSPGVYFSAFTRQEQDRFQQLRLRSTYTSGFGYQLVQSPTADLRVNTLGGVRREDLLTAGVTATPIIDLLAAYRQSFGIAGLAGRLDYAPKTGDFRDYILTSSGSITAKVYRGIGLRLEVQGQFNSRPQPGVRKTDVLTTTTLTYSIGA